MFSYICFKSINSFSFINVDFSSFKYSFIISPIFYQSSINYEKGKYKKALKRLSEFTIDLLSFDEMNISENAINVYEMMSNIAKFDLLVLKGKCLIKSKQTKEVFLFFFF